MVSTKFTKEEVFLMLSAIADPEIPVVNIRQMGMLRDVIVTDEGYEVILTPTYTGCPAMGIIAADIKATLEHNRVSPAKVTMVMNPAWSTDWMDDETKEKLRQYGIAPPIHSKDNHEVFGANTVPCPRCGSEDTFVQSRFGSTACKSLYKCNDCKEPFEYFKCHA